MAIRIKFKGRLGNQMFQYAAGLSLANKLNTELFIDYSEFLGTRTRLDFRLWEFENLPFRKLALSEVIKRRTGILGKPMPLEQLNFRPSHHFSMNRLGFSPDFFELGDGTDIDGWFQSIRYFNSAREAVLQMYDLSSFTNTIAKQVPFFEKPLAVVHVRRGDYVNHGLFKVNLDNYYYECLEDLGDAYNKILISDDLIWCKDQPVFRDYIDLFFSSETRSPLYDMSVFGVAEAAIISNSTFAWWGAYLSKKCKTVFAPKQWLSQWSIYDCGLDAPGWVIK